VSDADNAAHILVVDDDRRLRELLRKYLSENGFFVTVAEDAASAAAKLEGLEFDLLVLDIMMPGETGLEFAAAQRAKGFATPILMLTAMGDADDRIGGLEAGADDYLVKPFEPRELLLRINNILKRRPVQAPPPAPPRIMRFGTWRWNPEREELASDDGQEPRTLTTAEASLMRVLAQRPGEIVSRDELIERSAVTGNARTVDVQVVRLRRKLDDDARQPRYLVTVRGEGYVLRPD
jgi:two-component system phosphate regulon response regulator OmpR